LQHILEKVRKDHAAGYYQYYKEDRRLFSSFIRREREEVRNLIPEFLTSGYLHDENKNDGEEDSEGAKYYVSLD